MGKRTVITSLQEAPVVFTAGSNVSLLHAVPPHSGRIGLLESGTGIDYRMTYYGSKRRLGPEGYSSSPRGSEYVSSTMISYLTKLESRVGGATDPVSSLRGELPVLNDMCRELGTVAKRVSALQRVATGVPGENIPRWNADLNSYREQILLTFRTGTEFDRAIDLFWSSPMQGMPYRISSGYSIIVPAEARRFVLNANLRTSLEEWPERR